MGKLYRPGSGLAISILPPLVSIFPAGGPVKRAEMEPPLVRNRTGPRTSLASSLAPLVSASTEPVTSSISMRAPVVRAFTLPTISWTSIRAPLV